MRKISSARSQRLTDKTTALVIKYKKKLLPQVIFISSSYVEVLKNISHLGDEGIGLINDTAELESLEAMKNNNAVYVDSGRLFAGMDENEKTVLVSIYDSYLRIMRRIYISKEDSQVLNNL